MVRIFLFVIPLLVSVGLPLSVQAEPSVTHEMHNGVQFSFFPSKDPKALGVSIVPGEEGIEAIKTAFDVLFVRSPTSARAVQRLQAAGRIIIIYSPDFPRRALTSNTIAAFAPDFFQHEGDQKLFLVIVGRFGVKWPYDELASVLAHELLGHGIQHLENRIYDARNLDVECEAFLWTELAFQDLRVDKRRRSVIDIRKQIERHWCADFRRWSAANRPDLISLWQVEDPDIPALIDGYRDYLVTLN